MKLELLPELGLRAKAEHALDAFIDLLAGIKEYFFYKHVTLFEAFLFGLAATRALWFVAFGANSQIFEYFFSELFWVIVFAVLTVVHLAGFLTGRFAARIAAMYAHGIIWLFLAIMAGVSKTTAPVLPTFALYTIFSLLVIVRLLRERA